jgi:hypothetical protein
VPPAIIGRMVVTPPGDMVWLGPADLQAMGTTMIGKPSQVALSGERPTSPQQTAPTGAPQDLLPGTKASAPPTWNQFVDGAIALSARQNNGTAATARGCQPEYKVCWNIVIYKDSSGVETAAKVVRDMNEKIITREVCTFNSQKDIRRCFNWDTEAVHRDMQDLKGDWKKIADE